MYKKDAISLIEIGNISLNKLVDLKNDEFLNENESYSSESNEFNPNECECDIDERFDYQNIENALCGKCLFIPKRIIVIQMI